MPTATDRHSRFVHTPGLTRRSGKASPSTLVLRRITQHPAHDRGVGDDDFALSHHRRQITVAQPISDVPANAEFDGFSGKATTPIDCVAYYGLRHARVLSIGDTNTK